MNHKNIIMKAMRKKGLYHLQVSALEHTPDAHLTMDINVLPHCMGHIRMHWLHRMVAKNQIGDIDTLTGTPEFCESCVMGKMKKLPFKQSKTVACGPLDMVHSDVGGPIMPASPDGHKYWVMFVDLWSRHIWVLFAKRKSDVEHLYQSWKEEV